MNGGDTLGQSPRSRTTGFTLVELLVVITIIGILIGLLLPAVQQSREAARKVQCLNNVKQLATAAHEHMLSKGRLPLSPSADNRDGSAAYQAQVQRRNWIVYLLPYLEQQNAFNQMDFTIPGNRGVNLTVAKQNLPIVLCPSDRAALKPRVTEISQTSVWCATCSGDTTVVYNGSTSANVSGAAVALTSYAANSGDHHNQAGISVGYPPYYANDTYDLTTLRGVISRYGASATPAHMHDGLSNTLLLGEIVPSWCFWQSWALQSWATTANPINFQNYRGEKMGGDANVCIGFRSVHSGGAAFARCDGSVVFMSENIDVTTYRALASREGKDVISGM